MTEGPELHVGSANVHFAPIALFVYNRPDHTARTVQALGANEGASDSDLFVFADGPRSESDADAVGSVRRYINEITGFRSITVIERAKNVGLANSIISGVTEVLKKYDRVIVLEDDLVTSRFFLRFMNEALEHYKDDDRVASAHGYVYPVKESLPETFFLRGADCWGWACWRRSWQLFEPDGSRLIAELERQRLTRRFDMDGSYEFMQMLRDQVAGANNSWAVRWHAAVFLENKLTLYPGRSLVRNIGNDLSGSHGIGTTIYDVDVTTNPVPVGGIPVEESQPARNAFIAFRRQGPNWARPRRFLSRLLRKVTARF